MIDPQATSYSSSDDPSQLSDDPGGDDALQEPGATHEAVGNEPKASRRVREGDAAGYGAPRSREEAEATLTWAAGYCDNCPLRARCPEKECAVWQAEATAIAVLEKEAAEIPVAAGIPLAQLDV